MERNDGERLEYVKEKDESPNRFDAQNEEALKETERPAELHWESIQVVVRDTSQPLHTEVVWI